MKNKILFGLLSLIVVVGIIVAGCAKPAPPTAPPPAPPPAPPTAPAGPEEILLGSAASLTGMYAGFGQGGEFGMQAAVDDINKLGGVYVKEYDRKLPVKLIVINSESDPIKAGTLAEDLIVRDKINFLVSGPEPPTMFPGISTVADRYKVPFVVNPGPLEPWLGMRMEVEGHWEYTWAAGFVIVMPAPPGDFRAKPGYTITDAWKGMLDLFGDQTNKKAAVFASDDPDGIGWYMLFSGALKDWGYDAVGVDKKLGLVPMETTDFTSVINEWKDSKCEILWGNAPAPFVGTLLKQSSALGFQPKMASIGRGTLFYEDISAWGGDLPLGIGCEVNEDPSLQDSPGIGGTTPQSLTERWTEETGRPLNRCVMSAYRSAQILLDAIERAGTLDPDAVQAALAETDLMTIVHRVKFDENHFSRTPVSFGQWQKTDKPWVWECPIVFSQHDFIEATADPIFPIPYE